MVACHVERKRPTLSKETFEASYAPQLDHTVKEYFNSGSRKSWNPVTFRWTSDVTRVADIVDNLDGEIPLSLAK